MSSNLDGVLALVGHRHQTLMFLALCVPATFPIAFLTFSNLFTNAAPDHWCAPPPELVERLSFLDEESLKMATVPREVDSDGGANVFSKCRMYETNEALFGVKNWTQFEEWSVRFQHEVAAGNVSTTKCRYGWTYDRTYYDRTLITELNLVCENSKSPQTGTALFYVGSLFGNPFFGWVADRWGRRPSIMWMIVLEVIVATATSFSKDYQTFLIFRAIGGLFFPALYQIPFILGIEMMAPKQRPLAGMIICSMFAIAMCTLSVLAYLLRDWFKLSLATSVPFLLLFSYYWIIPESPQWLFSKGKLSEAEKVLQKIAHRNKVQLPKRILYSLQDANGASPLIFDESLGTNERNGSHKIKIQPALIVNVDEKRDIWNMQIKNAEKNIEDDRVRPPKVDRKEPNIVDILHYPNLRKKFLLLTFVWITNGVVYNGLSYNVTSLGMNDFLAFFISAAIELPSNVIAWKLMDVYGRKLILCATLAMGGLACVACMFVPEDEIWITVTLAMVGKFGVAASFAVFYVFVGESFPTVVRSQAMAVSSLLSSVGLLVFPYILQLGQYSKVLPLVALGIFAISGSLANLFLPDTLYQPMPQTLEDGENFGKDFKIFSLPKKNPIPAT